MVNAVKWGVIACGGIAQRRTIPGMLAAKNAELVAVMDVNRSVAEAVKKSFGAKYSFNNIEQLLEVDEIDAVYIASPVFCHLEQVRVAAKAKKHILLEKPLGINLEEAMEIVRICKAEGVKLFVGFMMRFHTYHQKLAELVSEGRLGEITALRAQMSCWYPEMPDCWRQQKELSGGGALMDMGIHGVDLIRYITGLEVIRVDAMISNNTFNYGVEDCGGIMMKLSNGAICYVDAYFNVPDDASQSKLEIYGTKGCAVATGTLAQVEGGNLEVICSCDDNRYKAMQDRTETLPIEIEVEFGNMYTKEIESFGESILSGSEVLISGDDAIASQAVIEAAYMNSSE